MNVRMLAAAALMVLGAVLSACDSGGANPTPVAGGPTSNPPAPAANTPAPNVSQQDLAAIRQRTIVVSSKDFTEEAILGELYAIVLEVSQVPVERKLNLGTTDIAQAALLKGGGNGGIDIYPEYTSTGLQAVLKQPAMSDPKQIYDTVKAAYKEKFNLTWLDMSPLNDTQAMVTTKDISDQKGLKSLEDVCGKADQLTIAARAEFKDRPDALPALQKIYGGCKFKEIKVVESNLLYKAVVDKTVDVAQADSTAGEIAGNHLVLLADPKGYGSPYNIAPVVRDDVLAAYPQIAESLNKLAPKITNEEMSALNWSVAGQGMDPHDVAKKWLFDRGLLKP